MILLIFPLARGPHVAVVGLLLDVALAEAPPPHQVGHVANTGSVLKIYHQSSHHILMSEYERNVSEYNVEG